jgi:hypothetical protein
MAPNFYDGVNVGEQEADLIVEGRVIIEVKAVTTLDDAHVAQCLNDMKATRLETCLLVNFSKARIQVRRLGMIMGASAGEVEREAKDVQQPASVKPQRGIGRGWTGMKRDERRSTQSRKADHARCELQEGPVDVGPALVAHREPLERSEPGEGPLHHPAMRPELLRRFDATPRDPRKDAVDANTSFRFRNPSPGQVGPADARLQDEEDPPQGILIGHRRPSSLGLRRGRRQKGVDAFPKLRGQDFSGHPSTRCTFLSRYKGVCCRFLYKREG